MTPTLAGALIAGFATSIHCAGMCGPLACGVGMLARSESERLIATCLYHGCRLASYTLIGTICGAIGRQPLKWFFDSPAVALPWAMVAVLLVMATGLDKKIPKPAFLVRFAARNRLRALRLRATGGAAVTGLMTPLLPCGPLYAVFLTLMASGSAAAGAEMALAFGIGTVPLLWVAQQSFHRWRGKIPAKTLPIIQRSMALVTAVLLAWRLHDTLPSFTTPPVEAAKSELPSCCH